MREATSEEIADALSFALLYQGRRRSHQGDQLMAGIVAKRLVEHLELCGFVVMKKPEAVAPRVPEPE